MTVPVCSALRRIERRLPRVLGRLKLILLNSEHAILWPLSVLLEGDCHGRFHNGRGNGVRKKEMKRIPIGEIT